MKLRDLEAQFCRREVRREMVTVVKPGIDPVAPPNGTNWTDDDLVKVERDVEYRVGVDTLAEADGIYFDCPLCFVKTGGKGHMVLCWFVGKVPDDVSPGPGRWTPSGTGIDDLTFIPSSGRSASVELLSGCRWHGVVANGDAT